MKREKWRGKKPKLDFSVKQVIVTVRMIKNYSQFFCMLLRVIK